MKKQIDTINITTSWLGMLYPLIAVLEHGTTEGRAMARKELEKMARLADAYVTDQKVKPAVPVCTECGGLDKHNFGCSKE